MKAIWHKYKVWLLISMFYAVYAVIKGFRTLKSMDI